MKTKPYKSLFLVAALMAGLSLTGLRAASNLVVDGGFEPPNPTAVPGEANTGEASVSVGDSFGGPSNDAWTVVQLGNTSNNVAVTSTSEYSNSSEPMSYYNANSGAQFLDLTGSMDNGAEVGIEQTVATVTGTSYDLTFYVGAYDGFEASDNVEIDGTSVGTYSNSEASGYPSYLNGVAGDAWEEFSYGFTASSDSTTVDFFNLSGAGVPSNGLDDVSLLETPEPSSWALVGAGLGLVALLRRFRLRA